MSVLSQQNTESVVIVENTEPQVRNEKVLEVRRQLAEGTYDIDKRLNIALDRLLEDLVA